MAQLWSVLTQRLKQTVGNFTRRLRRKFRVEFERDSAQRRLQLRKMHQDKHRNCRREGVRHAEAFTPISAFFMN